MLTSKETRNPMATVDYNRVVSEVRALSMTVELRCSKWQKS